MKSNLPSTKILGVNFTTSKKEEILDFIILGLKTKHKKFYIVTPNPEMIVKASSSSSFRNILNDAAVSLPDGIGIVAADNILKKELNGRITGVDFMLDIVAKCAEEGLSIGLLGGRDGVAEKVTYCLMEKYPNLIVNFAFSDWNPEAAGPAASPATKKNKSKLPTRNSHIDILFVAFGAPKQEEWIAKNLKDLPVTVAMGVGGSFDYISGNVKRAPKPVRKIGMEWAFRLVHQPWRIKRQLALPKFGYLVIKEKFKK